MGCIVANSSGIVGIASSNLCPDFLHNIVILPSIHVFGCKCLSLVAYIHAHSTSIVDEKVSRPRKHTQPFPFALGSMTITTVTVRILSAYVFEVYW